MSSRKKAILATIVIFMMSSSRGLTNPVIKLQDSSLENPDLIRIEMTPVDLLSKPGAKPYLVGSKLRVKMIVKNNSDQRVLVRVINPYYQNRPRLYKDNQLLPYRSEITRIVRSKDADPEFVSVGDAIFVEPYSSAILKGLELSDWYGPLLPGSYRLLNRYRLKIGGAWSADSAPLFFQVVREEKP